MGNYLVGYFRGLKGDTRSLDYSSYRGNGKENGSYFRVWVWGF